MAFDYDLAEHILDQKDRDSALFFAGRQAEIDAFDTAVREAPRGEPSVEFRIYQGAPGCGKTSLAGRLRQRSADALALVQVYEDDLASPRHLLNAIHRRVVRGNPRTKRTLEATGVLAALLRRESAGDALAAITANELLEHTQLAIHMDEAQVLGPAEAKTLRWLHNGRS